MHISLCASQRTQPVSVTMTNWLSVFRKIIDVYCKNRTNMNKMWHNADWLHFKAGKGKDLLRRPRGGVDVWLYSSFNLGARLEWVINATPRPLCPRERPGTHCIGGWVGPPGPDAENLAPTGIRSPDRPAPSESLYGLRYPGPNVKAGGEYNHHRACSSNDTSTYAACSTLYLGEWLVFQCSLFPLPRFQ